MKLILGSKSPRRQQLLQEMGYTFEIRVKDTDESFPDRLQPQDVAKHISLQKAKALQSDLQNDEILLCADTIVCVENSILGKPVNENDAKSMLQQLSGKNHMVITAVSIATKNEVTTDFCKTVVSVRALTKDEISTYIEKYKPYDKAGAYGIQEWFGAVAVEKIEGSYNNVVGLPTHLVYQMLEKFSI